LAAHFAGGEFAHGPQHSVPQVVLPLADFLAIAVFADAGERAVLEEFLEHTVLELAAGVVFALVQSHTSIFPSRQFSVRQDDRGQATAAGDESHF
jgi:hypothetical protein